MAGSNNSSRGFSYPWSPMSPGLFSRMGTSGPLASIGRATAPTPKPIVSLAQGAKMGPTTNKK